MSKRLLRFLNKYESPVPIWVLQNLYYAVWTPPDIKAVMNSPSALGKGDLYKTFELAVGSGIFSAPVPQWKKHRKIIAPTFNRQILEEYAEIFSKQANIFSQILEAKVGRGIFDILEVSSRNSLDVICETAMGVSVNAQTTKAEYFQWVNISMELMYQKITNIFYQNDFLFYNTRLGKALLDHVDKVLRFTAAIVTQKYEAYQQNLKRNEEQPEAQLEEEPRKKNSFLEQLIELSEKGANFTDKAIRDEVVTFIIGGGDTTANTNSFTFIMLGIFQDMQDKVYEEVLDVVGPDRPIESTDLGKLQYLERFIKETLRLFPPVPIIFRKITEDIKSENCILPAESTVVIVLLLLQRNPVYWPDPLKFDPDRFLREEVAKRHPYSWIPFSGGPRNCIGSTFAMMSMKMVMATLIRKYRFFTDYKSVQDVSVINHLMLKPVRGFRVSVELRE